MRNGLFHYTVGQLQRPQLLSPTTVVVSTNFTTLIKKANGDVHELSEVRLACIYIFILITWKHLRIVISTTSFHLAMDFNNVDVTNV